MNELEKYIPLDKSWIIRMGVLDIIYGKKDIVKFLNKQSILSDDLLALKRATESWTSDSPIDVGESGTLYRLLQFISWKLNLNKKFITKGTLIKRLGSMPKDPSIVNLNLNQLLTLPDVTSQWATASVLLGNNENIPNPPYKLQLTYEAIKHWSKKQAQKKEWEPKYDETIKNQAECFLQMLKGRKPSFKPIQAEDYCFARIFDYISSDEGEIRWPNLHKHESDRLTEMERTIVQISKNEEIDSKDHRVVQSAVMWGLVNKKNLNFKYPKAVNKSWPQFWDFIHSLKFS
jgi:hypothetical protein